MVRSLGKELRAGATAQLIHVSEGADAGLDSTLRFFLSPRSAYVSGQVVRVGAPVWDVSDGEVDWEKPLAGKVAVQPGVLLRLSLETRMEWH